MTFKTCQVQGSFMQILSTTLSFSGSLEVRECWEGGKAGGELCGVGEGNRTEQGVIEVTKVNIMWNVCLL